MPSGYLIVEVDVKDPERYTDYTSATPAVVAKYGGEFIVRGGKFEALEGNAPRGRVVVIEFPSYDRALEFYRSDDYADLLKLRLSLTESRAFLVEGAD
jgi:uncharacterized protein (DUF1330 family)